MASTNEYFTENIRTAAILTNSFVAATTIDGLAETSKGVHLNNQLILLVSFTIGSLTSAEVKVEYSADNTTFFQDITGSISGSTTTISLNEFEMTATGNYRIPIPLKDRFVKVSIQGTGTVTASSATIDYAIGDV